MSISSYTAPQDGTIEIYRTIIARNSNGGITATLTGTVTKTPSSESSVTVVGKNSMGLLYDNNNYFIVGMDNGTMKMKFVSGGVSMFDSTYSASAEE
jgi:hypothetical protein